MTNILFLMTDQQRWDTIDSNSGWVKTPNLDRIAQEGVCFDNCITTTPICMPARLTLATGQYPHNNHVWTNVNHTMSADADNWMREIKSSVIAPASSARRIYIPMGRTICVQWSPSCMPGVWMISMKSVAHRRVGWA